MDVVNFYDLGNRWFLGTIHDGTVLKAYVEKGARFNYANWFPANEIETNLYKAWQKYIDSTYDYEYEYEYE